MVVTSGPRQMYELREYQKIAVSWIWHYLGNKPGNPIVAMPTGTGKSLVIADFIKGVLQAYPTQRIFMITHVKELIAQNMEKLLSMWPTAPLGVYSAGLKRRDTFNSILLGGVQSINKALQKNSRCFGRIDLVLIDECHLLSPNKESAYQNVLKCLKELNPYIRVIGFTATPYRMKVGSIADDEQGLFSDVAFDLCSMENFNRLIDEGYLAPLIPMRPEFRISMEGVKITAGEYNAQEATERIDTEENTFKAVEEIVKAGANRKSWLIFASSIEHAEHICSMMQMFHIEAGVTHSRIPSNLNDELIRNFKSGSLRCLINCNKLTTGFDHPGIDLIGMLRATRSTGLWVQMLGRGTRPCQGKENCMVLDFVGNTERLGPINDPVIPQKPGEKKSAGEAPIKICENCGMYCHSSVRVCSCCNTTFPLKEKISKHASSLELIRTPDTISLNIEKPDIKDFNVTYVTYVRHVKRNSTNALPSMKVTYFCGFTEKFSEWVFFDHIGYVRKKAESWWIRHSKGGPMPRNVAQAIELSGQYLKQPDTIRVSISKDAKVHPIILDVTFKE